MDWPNVTECAEDIDKLRKLAHQLKDKTDEEILKIWEDYSEDGFATWLIVDRAETKGFKLWWEEKYGVYSDITTDTKK